LFPAQRRTRAFLQAMQAVNMDGHKIDVFVSVPWSQKPVRMYLVAIQDLFSGKMLSWRLADAETWETVRLVIGDMVELFGIPEMIFLDNGRAFASHWISGQARKRFRFKVKEEDPRGLLTTLGVETIFTTPYSGQSKPIERAFRDLADMIAKHPFCAGAYTGNKPDAKPENYGTRAIPLDAFREHVAEQIADHNAQEGRSAANCAGRSFDATFAAGMKTAIVTQPTTAQRSLWLLAAEAVRSQKGSGEIHYQGNRYWHAALNQHAGRKVTIRFDPDALHKPVRVYDLDNALICEAACIDDTGFRDVEAARHHGRARRDYLKAIAAQKAAHAKLSAQELADIIYRGKPQAPVPQPVRPSIARIAVSNLAVEQEPAADDFEESFERALSKVTGNASILEFPRGNEPTSSEYGSQKKGGGNPAQ
ncbi:MAG: transposase, partial [Nitratireductor sp.]